MSESATAPTTIPLAKTAQDGFHDLPPRSHLVRFFRSHDEIVDASCDFLEQGALAGEALFIASSAARLVDQTDELSRRGIDVDRLRAAGRIVLLDAEEVLSRMTEGGEPDRARFEDIIGEAVRTAAAKSPARRVRAYGEIVDLLWQAGELSAALRLESFWHDLLERQPVTLLCGYEMGLLSSDREIAAFEQVCEAHTHALPSEERGRLERAVDAALEETLGDSRAANLRPLIEATIHRNERLGRAERTIFWLRRNLPEECGTIVRRAQALFRATG